MFSFRKPTTIPTAADALPGRAQPLATSDAHHVNVSGRYRDRAVRPRLFLGGRALLLEAAGCLRHRGRLRRRPDAEPDLRGGLHRPNRA